MAIVRVALDSRSYDIVIEQGVLDRAGSHLAPHARKGRLVVVTDRHVAAAQLPRLEASLRRAGVAVEPVILPPGEQTKSWRHLEALLDADRQSNTSELQSLMRNSYAVFCLKNKKTTQHHTKILIIY